MWKNIKKLIKQLKCNHSCVWNIYPDNVFFKGKEVTHGAKLICCVKCGKIEFKDTAG